MLKLRMPRPVSVPVGRPVKRRIPRASAARLAELKRLVLFCFYPIDETDPKEVANRTGLSVSTILRLGNGGASLKMRVNTLQVLCDAAGIHYRWADGETIKVSLSRKG